ncbi:MAG: hypothetical protein PSN44_01070 [Gammaproteobacteria bacterium]|nr:hypothetical protein [Gammaproteobacteria bacterium]
MKKLFTALIGATLSMSVIAAESPLELLAGVEAGIDSDTAMTIIDLNKTQEILMTQPTGASDSWYNIDTTTHYDVIIGEHFSSDLRPCVAYKLIVKHSSKTENQDLNACMNYDGHWIAQLD